MSPSSRHAPPPGVDHGSNRILITTANPKERTAWSKARDDVLRILVHARYVPVRVPFDLRPLAWVNVLQQLWAHLRRGDQLLIEYPIDRRRRLLPLVMFCRLRQVRVVAVIHDLDSLRFGSSQQRDLYFLRLFDGLISHNPRMTAWLRAGGIRAPIADLEMFDYCTPVVASQVAGWNEGVMTSPLKVVCAGNLDYRKATYLYDTRLAEIPDLELALFGSFFEPQRMATQAIRHKGAFDPDDPRLDGTYHFGLIWDGNSIDGCEGRYGEYLRINSPHKLSLYAALGLPVLVWKEAAVANFVQRRGIGVAIGNLRELGDLPQRISNEAYQLMVANMHAVGQAVRQGHFLRLALSRLDLEN